MSSVTSLIARRKFSLRPLSVMGSEIWLNYRGVRQSRAGWGMKDVDSTC